MTLIHNGLATSVLYFMVIAGVFGLATTLRRRGIDGSYWGILAIGEVLILAEAVVGTIMYLGGARPGRPGVHILYGIVAVITLPAYYALSKGRDDRSAALVYSLLCFIVAIISLRSRITGIP
ncbi:MAG: hypothetical protein GTO14_25340 [Anaerolineales bacterium]|nr:hypothetical protein [Anaerolineales bacterium]